MKKNHATIRKVLMNGAGGSVWTSGSEERNIGSIRQIFIGGDRRTEKGMRLHKARSPTELRQVASGTLTQDFG